MEQTNIYLNTEILPYVRDVYVHDNIRFNPLNQNINIHYSLFKALSYKQLINFTFSTFVNRSPFILVKLKEDRYLLNRGSLFIKRAKEYIPITITNDSFNYCLSGNKYIDKLIAEKVVLLKERNIQCNLLPAKQLYYIVYPQVPKITGKTIKEIKQKQEIIVSNILAKYGVKHQS